MKPRHIIFSFLILSTFNSNAICQSLIVKITSRLGMEQVFQIKSTSMADEKLGYQEAEMLDYIIKGQAYLPLKIKDNAHILIPMYNVKHAVFKKDSLHVVLKSGELYIGRGEGNLIDNSGNKYGVNTILSFETDSTVNAANPTKSTTQKWNLNIDFCHIHNLEISKPSFVFSYYTTAGYIMGGENRINETTDFIIDINSDKMQTSLDAFNKINIKYSWPANSSFVTVTAPNGITSNGWLSLSVKDSKGIHYEGNWCLKSHLNNGSILVVKKEGSQPKEFTLEKR